MADTGDALATARNVHYAIIAGCAAAVLFAAIPDRTAPYRAAREDLDALRALIRNPPGMRQRLRGC